MLRIQRFGRRASGISGSTDAIAASTPHNETQRRTSGVRSGHTPLRRSLSAPLPRRDSLEPGASGGRGGTDRPMLEPVGAASRPPATVGSRIGRTGRHSGTVSPAVPSARKKSAGVVRSAASTVAFTCRSRQNGELDGDSDIFHGGVASLPYRGCLIPCFGKVRRQASLRPRLRHVEPAHPLCT